MLTSGHEAWSRCLDEAIIACQVICFGLGGGRHKKVRWITFKRVDFQEATNSDRGDGDASQTLLDSDVARILMRYTVRLLFSISLLPAKNIFQNIPLSCLA